MKYKELLEYYANAYGSFDLMSEIQINILIKTKLNENPVLKSLYKESSLQNQINKYIQNELLNAYLLKPIY